MAGLLFLGSATVAGKVSAGVSARGWVAGAGVSVAACSAGWVLVGWAVWACSRAAFSALEGRPRFLAGAATGCSSATGAAGSAWAGFDSFLADSVAAFADSAATTLSFLGRPRLGVAAGCSGEVSFLSVALSALAASRIFRLRWLSWVSLAVVFCALTTAC